MIRRSWLSTVGAIFYLHIGRAQLDQTRFTFYVTTLGHLERSRVFLTTSRWPRAAAIHGRKFSPIFHLISSNFLKTLSPDRTHTQIYTYTHNFLWIDIKIYIYIYKYIYKYIYITRNCFIIPSDETERERDRENGVKNSDPFHDDYWKYVEVKFDRGSTHHDRRPLHLNYD